MLELSYFHAFVHVLSECLAELVGLSQSMQPSHKWAFGGVIWAYYYERCHLNISNIHDVVSSTVTEEPVNQSCLDLITWHTPLDLIWKSKFSPKATPGMWSAFDEKMEVTFNSATYTFSLYSLYSVSTVTLLCPSHWDVNVTITDVFERAVGEFSLPCRFCEVSNHNQVWLFTYWLLGFFGPC